MFKYFVKSVLRNFVGHKSSFLINLIGLAASFACAILIFLWINDEIQVDKFHALDEQLYQVIENHNVPEGVFTQPYTPDMLGRTLDTEIAEVQMATGVMPADLLGPSLLTSGDKKIKSAGQFADTDFFRVFSFPLLQGDAAQVLKNKNSIVVSKQLAMSLFGSLEHVVGKVVELELYNSEIHTVVTGIFDDIPGNSTMQFEFVSSYDTWLELSEKMGRMIHWGNHAPSTYVVLEENTPLYQFNTKIKDLLYEKNNERNISLFAVPFTGQYLHGKYENGVQAGGRISYVHLFSLIAVFILAIAAINFMNLSTARATGRFKEIGIKKVVGSGRWSLIAQFVSESVLLTFSALLFSLLIVFLFLPQFNQITGKRLVLADQTSFFLLIPLAGFVLAVLTGLYPALYLSGFNSLQTLKAKLSDSHGAGWARKGLVTFQFTVSVVLIISVLVVNRQVEYIQNKTLGYNKNQVVLFDKETGIANQEEAFLQEAKKIPGLVNISSMGGNLIGSHSNTYDITWDGKESESNIRFEVLPVNFDLIETLEMEVVEGRSFSADLPGERTKVILNQKAVDIMGLKDPIGKTIRFWGEEKQIVGVLQNFNFESLREEINPLIFYMRPDRTVQMMARIEAGREKQVLQALGALYEQFNSGLQFNYHFMDTLWDAQYEAEQRVGVLSRLFAILGILISCLGLFGLAAFAAERRIKEIGIRKVTGANISEVMVMLNMDFIKWVTIAILIASPIAWYILGKWLESFAFKATLSWWIFALAGLLALGIALLTVSWQSWRAATRNPVEALRYE